MSSLDEFRTRIAEHMWRMTQIPREEIFGFADELMPDVDVEDAKVMHAGYIGINYQPGGVLIIGRNPGGGGGSKKDNGNEILYPELRKFKQLTFSKEHRTNVVAQFEITNKVYAKVVKYWEIWEAFEKIQELTYQDFSQFAFINLLPYRTTDNERETPETRKNSWIKFTHPTINALAPSVLIVLGGVNGGNVSKLCNKFGCNCDQFKLIRKPKSSHLDHQKNQEVYKKIRDRFKNF
ncbi:MAG: hypothetical protein HPY85_16855 [Anaerolineae bacterium]|nr:hypothetical protein [Anaerolineae bacterium]